MGDRWDWNGPEEGDEIDLTVVIMFDGEEVITLEGEKDTFRVRKAHARAICKRLNEGGATI